MRKLMNKIGILSGSGLFLLMSACTISLQPVTFVLLPDTQGYAEKFPEILHSQVDWIVAHAGEIDFVLQQGDLTDDNNDEQWAVVQSAFSKLDGKVPYTLAPGNHDMGSKPGLVADTRNTDQFNRTFPCERMSRLPGYGGVLEEGKMENSWYFLQKSKHAWMILTLEFGPRDSVLHMASDLIAQNPDKIIILNTHSYMYSDSTRQGGADKWRPQVYGIGKDSLGNRVNDGEQLWTNLVKKHPGIRFVFSGHVLNSGVGTLISINDAGYPVYQFLANFQGGVKGSVNEGNGNLRILTFNPKRKTLAVATYSPWLDRFLEDEAHQFTIKHVILKH